MRKSLFFTNFVDRIETIFGYEFCGLLGFVWVWYFGLYWLLLGALWGVWFADLGYGYFVVNGLFVRHFCIIGLDEFYIRFNF